MSVHEAVALVLQASAHGLEAAARGQIFVLDMGKPVRIVDVARQVIRLAGMRPDLDVGIEFTGLRPGEKLYEELFDEFEDRLDGGVEGILVALSKSINLEVLRRLFDELAVAAAQPDHATLLRLLAHAVPSYHNPQPPMPQDAVGEQAAQAPIRALWGYPSNPRYVAEQP